MRIALIAPPFISVPPQKYGGTELFVAVLADALHAKGHQVVVYANGDSRVNCELRWRYRRARWPIVDAAVAPLENLDHTVWALHDAAKSADVIHLNDAIGLPATMFVDRKNDLLSRAQACLFPIDWDEPFGLVMIESMACGTPVLALPGGSVPEVVCDGVSGWICRDVDDMAARLGSLDVAPASCRTWV